MNSEPRGSSDPDRDDRRSQHARAVLVPALTLSVLLAVMAGVAIWDRCRQAGYDRIVRDGVPTIGLVTACKVRNDVRSGSVCCLDVCYYTDGTAGPPQSASDGPVVEGASQADPHGTVGGWVTVPQAVYQASPEGTSLPIRYLEKQPATFVVVGARPEGWPWPTWLILGALCLASFWGLHRAAAK